MKHLFPSIILISKNKINPLSIHRIFDQKQRLSLFLETESLNKYLLTNRQNLNRLLGYSDCKHFNFIRSNDSVNSNILDRVDQFVVFSEDKSDHIELRDKHLPKTQYQHIRFGYQMGDIQAFAEKIYDKDTVNSNDLKSMLIVFIHSAFILYQIYSKNAFAFVTQNRTLLENREWLEKKIGLLNIMNVQESMVYMDLYAKNHFAYYQQPHNLLNKEWWYLKSFRTKIPHYHVPTRENQHLLHILEGFASRFMFLLLAVDEIGMQVYFPKDRDMMIPYHFNYFLSLATGIFDNLAIETKQKYKIKFKGDHIPSRISLSKGGEDFLDNIKDKNPDLHTHIKNYGQFRKLIYELREVATHREGFREMGYRDSTGFSFFFVIQKETSELIRFCGDKPSDYDKFSNWGVFDNESFIFLEPYRFVVAATNQLIKFSDDYLKLMDFKEYVETDLELFKKSRLGF